MQAPYTGAAVSVQHSNWCCLCTPARLCQLGWAVRKGRGCTSGEPECATPSRMTMVTCSSLSGFGGMHPSPCLAGQHARSSAVELPAEAPPAEAPPLSCPQSSWNLRRHPASAHGQPVKPRGKVSAAIGKLSRPAQAYNPAQTWQVSCRKPGVPVLPVLILPGCAA